MSETLKIDCPTCKKKTLWSSDNENRPFCSQRCKLIDLGAWANEEYSIPAEPDESWSENDNETINPNPDLNTNANTLH